MMKTKLVSIFSALAMAASTLGAPALSHAYGRRHELVITSPVHVYSHPVYSRPYRHAYVRAYGGGPVVVVRHERGYRHRW